MVLVRWVVVATIVVVVLISALQLSTCVAEEAGVGGASPAQLVTDAPELELPVASEVDRFDPSLVPVFTH
jgi:hypothetical protein